MSASPSACEGPERWAVYVFEIKGPVVPTWYVVGRLLQRPWSRVGGGGDKVLDGPVCPEAREWLARKGLLNVGVWVPMGSLITPDQFVDTLRPYRPQPAEAVKIPHTFASLGLAREAAQRMANVVCPRDQTVKHR